MEVVGSFLASAGGTAGTAAAGTAAAATGASIAGTIFSVLTGYVGAAAKKKAIEAQSAEASFQAADEYIAGKETQAALWRELTSTVSSQAVGFAASGVSLASQSVQDARQQAITDAEGELQAASLTSERRRMSKLREARNLDRAAKNVMIEQHFKTIGQAIDLAGSIGARGGGGGDAWAGMRG